MVTLRQLVVVLVVAAATVHEAQAQAIDLDDIVEIRGYHPPLPNTHSPAAKHPTSVDITGSALRAFLSGYVPVRNEAVVASAFSSASATAVFRDVDSTFVIFQLRDLCRQPPPGFTPRR